MAKEGGGSKTHDGGKANGHQHETDDIFQLRSLDHSALSFIKASDVIAFESAGYFHELSHARAPGHRGPHHSPSHGPAGHGQHEDHDGPRGFAGDPETFQQDSVGTFTYSSFPRGWLDFAAAGPPSDAPQPSAVVINTTDAYGHMTKALAILPAVSFAQGIFRPIDSTNYYATHADVRIDQFGDTDPTGAVEDPNNPGFFLCGCPVEFANSLDWTADVGFLNTADPDAFVGVGICASAQTHTWHLWAETSAASQS